MRERHGDFDEALASVGQLAHPLERIVAERQRLDQLDRLVDHRAFRAGLSFIINNDNPSEGDDRKADDQSSIKNQNRPEEITKKYLITFMSLLATEGGYGRKANRVIDPAWRYAYGPLARGVAAAALRLNALQFLTIRRYLTLVFCALILLLIVVAAWR